MRTGPAVLVTRPEPGASAFADALRARIGPGAHIVVSPVMRIAFREIAYERVKGHTLLFTSSNGVRAAQDTAQGATAFCVGLATTEAARQAGIAAECGGETVEALFTFASQRPEAAPFLHIRGAHARGDLSARLSAAGLAARDVVAYDQSPQPLTAQAIEIAGGPQPVILPIFSPRSAGLLGGQLTDATAPLWCVFMSAEVAAAWTGPRPARAVTVQRPDGTAMLDATATLCGVSPA